MGVELESIGESDLKGDLGGKLSLWKNVYDGIQSGDHTPHDPDLLRRYTREVNGLITESGLTNRQLIELFGDPMKVFLDQMRAEAEARAARN